MTAHSMRLLMEAVNSSIVGEAVVDTPQDTLCDIFTSEGKLKDEVSSMVLYGIKTITAQFPEAKLQDYWMVGATVTYQYSDTSDIDTTLVYDPTTPQETFDKIWDFSRTLENQIPAWMGKRPFQFTPQKGGSRSNIPNADAAYDVLKKTWIKEPPPPKEVSDMYQQDIGNASSQVRKTYSAAERVVQPVLQRLAHDLDTWGKSQSPTDWSHIMQLLKSAKDRYDSLQNWRNKAYTNIPTNRPSQNWNTGNLIYKMFDREGYHNIFVKIKQIVNLNDKNKQQTLATQLSSMLNSVIHDEIGYVPESHQPHKETTMDATFFRKYADIIQAAHTSPLQEAEDAPVSQAELTNLYKQGKPVHFVKNTPVALVPFQQLGKLVGDQAADKIKQLAGAVDKTSYDQAYKDNGYVVFQWNTKDNSPDIYIANPNVVKSKYVKFMGQLPSDAKSRSKIPSLVVMQHLNVDPSRMPFYVKVVPVEMVHVDDLGLANKTIQTNWGEQTVQAGGYLVREENGHIYTVAPDAQGLPIGYVKTKLIVSELSSA